MAWTYKLAGWDLGLALGNERGRSKYNYPLPQFSDLCGRRPLRDKNLEVCRFADVYRLTGTQILAINSKPNIKVRTALVTDRTARQFPTCAVGDHC